MSENNSTPKPSTSESPNDSGEKSQQQSSSSSSSTPSELKEMINIIVKTSKEREQFQLANNASVKDLRQMVSERYKVEPHKVCLIFSGKILKDGDTLENHKMKDGYIVHLVIRDVKTSNSSSGTSTSNATTSSTATRASTEPTTTTNPAAPPMSSLFNMFLGPPGANNNNNNNNVGGGLPTGMPPMGAGAGGPFDLNQQMMQQLNNPEFMRQMLESPLMQNLYSNPEIFRSIISSNPQFQQLIERNPELNHVLSSPDILRQTFEMMRNPATFQELMRSHDRALSNLESLPGGYNALRRMYTELQEPMINAAQEQFGNNPFVSTTSANSTSSSTNTTSTTPSNTENREPLPNPWQRSNTSTPARPAPGDNRDSAFGVGGGGGGLPFNMLAPGSMQQMMQQMNENPQLVQSLVNSPMMQNMMQNMMNNPQLLHNNPFMPSAAAATGANNTTGTNATSVQANSSLSQNPLYQRIQNNPQAMQAFTQIQRGYEQLIRILGVPVSNISELFSNNPSLLTTSSSTSNNSSTTAVTTSTSTTTASSIANPTGTTTTTPSATGNPSIPNANLLAQMMQHMLQVPAPAVAENRYEQQLLQLEAMGFTNREANLRALIETFGNVEAAIDRLLSRM
nr:ubiquilin-4-like [Dermatophagoides pteronyssinus]